MSVLGVLGLPLALLAPVSYRGVHQASPAVSDSPRDFLLHYMYYMYIKVGYMYMYYMYYMYMIVHVGQRHVCTARRTRMACGGVRAVACGACVHAVRFARSRRMACVRCACVRWCAPFVELMLSCALAAVERALEPR